MQRDKLIIAQVDHASGEVVGQAVQELMQLGTKNVQLLQSVTKKGRPGYLLLIDLPGDRVDDVAIYMAAELGIWGYHILDSQHVHFDISYGERTLRLIAGDKHAVCKLKPKYIRQGSRLLAIKLDHGQLVEIQRHFKEWGFNYPLRMLQPYLEARVWQEESGDILLSAGDLPDCFGEGAPPVKTYCLSRSFRRKSMV